MIRCFILSTIFFIVVASREELLVFNKNQNELQKCMEYNLSIDDDFYTQDTEIMEAIAKLLAKRVCGRTIKKSDINKHASSLFYYLKTYKAHMFEDHQICGLRAIKETLIYCSNDDQSVVELGINSEPRELSNVLDYILVDWPVTLYEMIHTRKGRMILRRYAEEAQPALNLALSVLPDDLLFRHAVRDLWMRRAYIYFDSDAFEFDRLRHRYTLDKGLFVQGEIRSAHELQYSKNFLKSNLRVPQSAVDIFLNIHLADRSPNVKRDIFQNYEKFGMSLAEYHIEYHIDQFYRVLIFFMDLKQSGVATDESDIYLEKPIPYEILREELQQMISNNYIYQQILLHIRVCSEILKESSIEVGLFLSTPYFVKDDELSEYLSSTTDNSMVSTIYSTRKLKYRPRSNKKSACKDYNSTCVITKSLNDCKYNGPIMSEKNNVSTDVQLNFSSIIEFYDEQPEVSIVLEYILVDWPTSLHDMICTRSGRATLRRYTKDAFSYLKNALDSVTNHDHFRYLIRSLWMLRARRYFDGHDTQVPYLRYHFTLENPFPQTHDDRNQLISRSALELIDRDPLVPPQDVHRVIYIHAMDRPYREDEHDHYSYYEQYGMTSTNYYIETHIDQFYRILFFFMELRLYGIQTDEDDVWDGSLPFEVVPNFIQEIVCNDMSYRNFLLFEKRRLQKTFNESQVEILSSARVYEEDLISLLNLSILKFYDGANTETTESSFRTKYNQSRRKECDWVNDKGMHFSKRLKSISSENSCYHYQDSITGVFRINAEPTFSANDSTYGYVFSTDSCDQLSLLESDSLTSLQVLTDNIGNSASILRNLLKRS